jgi:hypothetical protein
MMDKILIANFLSFLTRVSAKKHFMLNQNTTALPWGQSEPMTLRISSLLKSYTDGLAVFKAIGTNTFVRSDTSMSKSTMMDKISIANFLSFLT